MRLKWWDDRSGTRCCTVESEWSYVVSLTVCEEGMQNPLNGKRRPHLGAGTSSIASSIRLVNLLNVHNSVSHKVMGQVLGRMGTKV